jgi:NADH-quinone oxidoreductase subunit H
MTNLLNIITLIISLTITIMLYALWERKLIGFIQSRFGPSTNGIAGILQPILDVTKLLLKSIIIPNKANKFLFVISPIAMVSTAITAWAVIPITPKFVLSNLNIGILYLLAIHLLGVNAVIIAGWASNSKYALFGTLRYAAQMISYFIPMGLSIVGVLLKSNSMNLIEIVDIQQGGINNWLFIPLLPLLLVYWACSMVATHRAPFDVANGDSELITGLQVEYSGIGVMLFFLAEYSNMILSAVLTVIMFFGGWLSPFDEHLIWVPGYCWLLIKTFIVMTLFSWVAATIPRYRYDQVMRLCWKLLIPVALLWVIVELFLNIKAMVVI